MARSWTLYTYPGCTSCRAAEAWLKEMNIDVTKVHIYNDPPDRQILKALASKLQGGVSALIGTRGRAYKELGLAGKALSDDEWLDLIEKTPRLLRRPILTDGDTVMVGFVKEAWEKALAGASKA